MTSTVLTIFCLALVALVSADYSKIDNGRYGLEAWRYNGYGSGKVDYYAYPKYAYKYDVKDLHTGDIKTQEEERDGDRVHGHYSLVESDGSIRVVNYHADKHSGFNADVKKIGPNVHYYVQPAHNLGWTEGYGSGQWNNDGKWVNTGRWNNEDQWNNGKWNNGRQWDNNEKWNNERQWDNSGRWNAERQWNNEGQWDNSGRWNQERQWNNAAGWNQERQWNNAERWNAERQWKNAQRWNQERQWNNAQRWNQERQWNNGKLNSYGVWNQGNGNWAWLG